MADKVRIEFVDRRDAAGSQLTVTAEQLAGSGQCDDFANGILQGRSYKFRNSVMGFGGNYQLIFDCWRLWHGLGRIARTWPRKCPERIVCQHLPSPQAVLAVLEQKRRSAYAKFRALFNSPDELIAHLANPENASSAEILRSGKVSLPCHT